MASDNDAGILADEEARNSRYLTGVTQKLNGADPLGASRNSNWTPTGRVGFVDPTIYPLIGRVGLLSPHENIETDSFYIGSWHYKEGDFEVCSWAAPIAHAFYGTGGYPDFDSCVQITRVFHHRQNELVGFSDDLVHRQPGGTPFDRRTPLRITAPPRPLTTESSAAAAPTSLRWADNAAGSLPADLTTQNPALAPAFAATGPIAVPAIRHREALVAALAAPRQAALHHVLGTLQPDQYDLVTRPADRPLVIQGHPGSGKTIVATHRAAYLVNEDRPEGTPVGQVLLLGPTSNFVEHTSPVIDALTRTGRVEITTMADLLHHLLPGLATDSDGENESGLDYSNALGVLVEDTAAFARKRRWLTPELSPKGRTQVVYERLRQRYESLSVDQRIAWGYYLHALPTWSRAQELDRLAPLLGHCALTAQSKPPIQYDHIIVDEAQDLRPLEWRILSRINRGGWTIVGDMNQRRAEYSYDSWERLTTDQGIFQKGNDDKVIEFRAAYRSTSAILDFAGKLLPAEERTAVAVQDGAEAPTVVRTMGSRLVAEVGQATKKLTTRHHKGTLAIIAINPIPFAVGLNAAHWTLTNADGDTWKRYDTTLRLLTPADARGLEFDAVIVVEPGDFPTRLGRHYVLYTSLTRANRELMVFHSKALPAELQKAVARRNI